MREQSNLDISLNGTTKEITKQSNLNEGKFDNGFSPRRGSPMEISPRSLDGR
jgi:hypothetical protein